MFGTKSNHLVKRVSSQPDLEDSSKLVAQCRGTELSPVASRPYSTVCHSVHSCYISSLAVSIALIVHTANLENGTKSLAINTGMGRSLRIAIFVNLLLVTIGWIVHVDPTLHFHAEAVVFFNFCAAGDIACIRWCINPTP